MIKQLYYRLSDGKYVAKADSGTSVYGLQYVESVPSLEWNIQHNLKTIHFIIQIFINNIKSDADIKIINDNLIKVQFITPQQGFANIIALINK